MQYANFRRSLISCRPTPSGFNRAAAFLVAIFALGTAPFAFAQSPLPYGAPVSHEEAKAMLAAAEAKAAENKWPVAIAIVDGGGHLVAFSRLNNTQLASIEIALQKAKTSAFYRRPSKVFEETLATGGENLRVLKLPGALPIEGGLPIVKDGKIIGAIGVSGVKSTEDAQVAAAGLAALASSADAPAATN